MAIVSFVDQVNNAGNFDVFIGGNLIQSFLLNVGHEGVEISTNEGSVVTTLADFTVLATAIRVWMDLVDITFHLPKLNPVNFVKSYTQSPDFTQIDFRISDSKFSINSTNSDGALTFNTMSSVFLNWGEFNYFISMLREFISTCININQIPN